jgi:hypothetical protein
MACGRSLRGFVVMLQSKSYRCICRMMSSTTAEIAVPECVQVATHEDSCSEVGSWEHGHADEDCEVGSQA